MSRFVGSQFAARNPTTIFLVAVIEPRMVSGRKGSGHSLSKHNLAKFSGHAHFYPNDCAGRTPGSCAFTASDTASSTRHANDIALLGSSDRRRHPLTLEAFRLRRVQARQQPERRLCGCHAVRALISQLLVGDSWTSSCACHLLPVRRPCCSHCRACTANRRNASASRSMVIMFMPFVESPMKT